MIKWIDLNPPERQRIYIFATHKLKYKDVVRINVSESGHHRLELADGSKHIIAPKWDAIELDMDAWTF